MVELPPFARLLFIGMWNFALCDHGHLADDAKRLKLQILPNDDVDVDELVHLLLEAGRVVRGHLPDGRSYLHIPRFADHQKLDKRWSPRCHVCAGQRPAEESGDSANSTNHAKTPPDSPKLPDTPATSPQDRTGQDSKEKPPVVPLVGIGTDKPTKSAGRKRPAKPLPDDWKPNERHVAKARELGID